jgi:putative transcriptional regulator
VKDYFKIKHNQAAPAKGKILIAEPFLRDVYFQRSVVLLVSHNKLGSMGFVLNHRMLLHVNDFFEELKDVPKIPVYLGGPVASNRLFFIHSLDSLTENSEQITDNLYLDGDLEKLMYHLRSGKPLNDRVKFFIGYSGWSENQLSREINENSWLIGEASDARILHSEDESFWTECVQNIGGEYLTWLNYPKDPTLN